MNDGQRGNWRSRRGRGYRGGGYRGRGGGGWRREEQQRQQCQYQSNENCTVNNRLEEETSDRNHEGDVISGNWDDIDAQPTFCRNSNFNNRRRRKNFSKNNRNENESFSKRRDSETNLNDPKYDVYDSDNESVYSSCSQQSKTHSSNISLDNRKEIDTELPNNLVFDYKDKVSLIRNMKAKLKDISQSIDPAEIVKRYRQEINDFEDVCLRKHEKNFDKIKLLTSSENKLKKVWEAHLDILKQQQKTFQQFIANEKSSLTDIYGIPADSVMNKCEEIKKRIVKESKIFKKALPIYSVKEKILSLVNSNALSVISADAGYYASAIIPLFLRDVYGDVVIVSCEPNVAMCVHQYYHCMALAQTNDSSKIVAYQTHKDSIKTEDTKILFTTVQELISSGLKDPNFAPYFCIIFHCALRRTVEADFLLETLRQCLSSRKNFKVILIVPPPQDFKMFEAYFSVNTTVGTLVVPDLIIPVTTMWKTGQWSNDYANDVVDVSLAIHALEEQGDVLIFLPAIKDLKKMSALLLVKFHEYGYDNVECICIYEDFSDQDILNINHTVNDKRKFILATSWAEQVVIPTVSYVVDTGLTRDRTYDPTKCLELKVLTLISQSRAKVRKYCVGRTRPGKCYRLYNRHNYAKGMILRELPDILRKNPYDIMVKMFQYKPQNTMEVQFVEPLSKKTKENAVDMLKKANAIKDGHLTQLGQRIVKLPFLPRYSKLIVMGSEWGFAFESIILVALYLVKQPMFLQGNSKEEQKKSEASKLQLLVRDSDTLTFLNVYRSWMENNFSEAWCKEHCLNLGALQKVRCNVTEILSIVSEKLKEDFCTEVHSEENMDWRALQEVIFDCFKDNLCLYSGHYRSGYSLSRAKSMVFLHPASPLLQKKQLPEYVVFSDLHSSGRNYMFNVTAIPEEIVVNDAKNGSLHLKPFELLQNKLVRSVIEPVGITLIKSVLLGDGGRKLHSIEEKIKKETKSDLIVIEPSAEKGTVTIFSLSECKEQAEIIIRHALMEKAEDLMNEEETRTLDLKRGQQKVSVSVTWVKGGSTIDLKVSDGDLGKKVQLKEKPSSSIQDTDSITCSVELTWPRRLCKGRGFLTFSDRDFILARRLSMKYINIKGAEAEIQVNKQMENQLFISNLNADTTEEDVKQAIENMLPGIFVLKSTLIKQKAFKTTDSELQKIKDEIENTCCEITDRNNFTVVVSEPKDFDNTMTAHIKMNNSADIERASDFFNGVLLNKLTVKARPVYSSAMFCTPQVFEALRDKLDEELQNLSDKFSRSTVFPDSGMPFQFYQEMQDYTCVCFKFTASKLGIMRTLHQTVQKLLEGIVVNSDTVRGLHKLFTHGGHLWLRSLEQQENIYIMEEYRTKILRLYGSTAACQRAVNKIMGFMEDVEKETVSPIDLSQGKNVRTLLKAVIQNYGFDLKGFIKEFNLRSAELDIRAQRLTVHGSYENIERAVYAVEELGRSCSSQVHELLSSQESCAICGVPPYQLSIRLEHCGHLYCAECLRGLIANSQFPIQCCADSCVKEIILEDMRITLNYDEKEIGDLLKRSMTAYISKNSQRFCYCPAADCSMFFDKTEVSGEKWKCPLCLNDICIRCNVVYHHGYSCEMYQGSKADPNFSFKVWMKETNPNCKQCPKCNTGIEKTIGCNHMTCYNCRAHFCWLCCKAFPTGDDVYNHQPYCKGQGRR